MTLYFLLILELDFKLLTSKNEIHSHKGFERVCAKELGVVILV